MARRLAPEHLDRLEAMVRDARTWALVDPLAHIVAGTVLTGHPDVADANVERWSLDEGSFWVRRLAVLSLSRPVRAGVVPFATFAAVADRLLDEREFFIRKAIGWVLRDIGRDDPASVEAFCRPRMARMSTVTWREARKRLAPEVVAELDRPPLTPGSGGVHRPAEGHEHPRLRALGVARSRPTRARSRRPRPAPTGRG